MHLGRISAYIFNLIHHEMVAHKKTKKKNSLLWQWRYVKVLLDSDLNLNCKQLGPAWLIAYYTSRSIAITASVA